jgi:hypothetical protein
MPGELGGYYLWCWLKGRLRRILRRECADCSKQTLSIAKGADPEFPQVGVRQGRQDIEINSLISQWLGIFVQSQAIQPGFQIHEHPASTAVP